MYSVVTRAEPIKILVIHADYREHVVELGNIGMFIHNRISFALMRDVRDNFQYMPLLDKCLLPCPVIK